MSKSFKKSGTDEATYQMKLEVINRLEVGVTQKTGLVDLLKVALLMAREMSWNKILKKVVLKDLKGIIKQRAK